MFYLLVLAVAYLAATASLQLLRTSSIVRFFGDAPNHRKVHQYVVPRIGGLGIILAFLMVLGLRLFAPGDLWPISGNHFSGALLFIALFLAITGTLDDVRQVSFKVKFMFQFAMASGITFLLGHHFDTLSLFGHRIELGWTGDLITVFWIVAVMNAFNIIDGIDGLAGGAALCGFGAVAVLAYSNYDAYLLSMSIAFMGLTLGFLRFNLSTREKVFLGDSGSQFLGAVLAMFAIEATVLPGTRHSAFVPLLIVGYPLFDTTVAMARRFLKGSSRSWTRRFSSMFMADNEHLHHRLVYLGLSHLQSGFLLMMVAGSFAVCAVLIARLDLAGRMAVLTYLGVALFLILNRLGYVGIRPWVTFPRVKTLPGSIVGVIEPDEVFFHSLKSFKQDKFEFLSMPAKLTKFMGDDLVAVMVYNAAPGTFTENWTTALRAIEYHDCPAVVIADAKDIDAVRAQNPDGFDSIHFIAKPVRVPDLVRDLERFTNSSRGLTLRPRERKFSLAELAMRNNDRR